MKLPERWLKYRECDRINETRFVAFKTPLKEKCFKNRPIKSFTPHSLMLRYPKIKLVIDLTFTTKYYNPNEFEENGIRYKKIQCKGRSIPHEENFRKFLKVVNTFLKTTPNDYLIGVHCTHGVNRTGYFIVRYLIEQMGYSPQRALKVFNESRGHAIEREPYIADLLRREK